MTDPKHEQIRNTTGSEAILLLLREAAIIADLARRRLRRVLPAGLGEAQFDLLNHLVNTSNRHETPTELARLFDVSRPAMTQTLGRLRAAGLVELQPSPGDARARRVRLTAAGRTRHGEVVEALGEDIDRLGARLQQADLEALLVPLRHFRLEAERTIAPQLEEHCA